MGLQHLTADSNLPLDFHTNFKIKNLKTCEIKNGRSERHEF